MGYLKQTITHLIAYCLGIVTTLAIGYLVFVYFILQYPAPWKITNSANPHFDAKAFSFEDYNNGVDLAVSLSCMLPLGTEKEYVETILIDIGGATAKPRKILSDASSSSGYEYYYSKLRSKLAKALLHGLIDDDYNVIVEYDKNNQVSFAHFLKNDCKKESQ